MKHFYTATIISLLFAMNVMSQTLCQNQLDNNNIVSGNGIGQSIFMAGCSGYFDSIELYRQDDGGEVSAELIIYIGQTFMGDPLYTQTVTIPEGVGPFDITLGGGMGDLSFFENNQYTFVLFSPLVEFGMSSDIDSYVDGQLFVEVGFINYDDLWFRLHVTSTLGNDIMEAEQMDVFPNPAQYQLQLSGIKSPQRFSIINMMGITVMQGIATAHNAIGVQNLSNGIYFLKLEDHQIWRFVKN